MRFGICVLAALALAAASGCTEPRVSLGAGPREYVTSDYAQVLKRWTRSESLIAVSELDDLLTVSATYESWDFRWAYVVRYAQDYRLTVDQRRVLLEKTLGETQEGHRFYVALYGTNRRWTDLTAGDDHRQQWVLPIHRAAHGDLHGLGTDPTRGLCRWSRLHARQADAGLAQFRRRRPDRLESW